MPNLSTLFSSQELETILGTFDTSGPCVSSYPRYPLFGPLIDPKTQSLNFNDYIKLAQTSHIFPLSYEPGNKGIIILAGPDVLEQLVSSGTIAHEMHHLLNLCSSPFGYLLHLNQMILNIRFKNISDIINAKGNFLKIKFPVFDENSAEALDTSDKEIVENFRSEGVGLFFGIQRSILGKFDVPIDNYKDPFIDIGGGHKPLKDLYKLIDSVAKTNLASYLDHVRLPENTSPLFKLAKTDVSCELGGLQIAECIANFCEFTWLNFVDNLYFEGLSSQKNKFIDFGELDKSGEIDVSRFRDAIKQNIFKCISGNPEYIQRYRSPELAIQTVLKSYGIKAISHLDILFICWMALMIPIDPRTLHLVKKYQMQWEDIHPGYRLLNITRIFAKKQLSLPKGLSELRTSISQYFNIVASELEWPDFKELTGAMSIPHKCESDLIVFGMRDPFIDIYEQINSRRENIPWCDILPGPELTQSSPIFIPLLIDQGILRISTEPCGMPGFTMYSFSKIIEFCIFGDRDAMLQPLFGERETFKAAHEFMFDWDFNILEMEYNRLNKK